MAVQKKRIDAHVDTMRAIAGSKSVGTFYIGVTSRDPWRYWSWYRRNGYDHVVILADWLNHDEAKGLEEVLQKRCREADKRSPLWRKAHEKIKFGRYFLGARSKLNQGNKTHAVYMAWYG